MVVRLATSRWILRFAQDDREIIQKPTANFRDPASDFRPPASPLRPPIFAFRSLLAGLSLLTFNLGATSTSAAPVDLGEKLAYVRLEHLPADVPALVAGWVAPSLIVDLRHAAGELPKDLDDALPVRARYEPLFALVGPATPGGVLAYLRERAPGIITIGPAATTDPRPDLPIAVTPEADRSAYEAFAAGRSLDSLINEKVTKPRFDEAELVREHANGTDGADAPEGAAAPVESPRSNVEGPGGPVESRTSSVEGQNAPDTNGTPSAAPPTAPTTPSANHPPSSTFDPPGAEGSAKAARPSTTPAPAPPPPVDTVLQRAVQLHRALLALGRLPRG